MPHYWRITRQIVTRLLPQTGRYWRRFAKTVRARTAFARGDFSDALSGFERALRTVPAPSNAAAARRTRNGNSVKPILSFTCYRRRSICCNRPSIASRNLEMFSTQRGRGWNLPRR